MKDEVELTGKVVPGSFARGSKSESQALHIETSEGSFVLRRKGGNPFHDPLLEQFSGKRIVARGVINNYVFIASDLKEDTE